MENKKTNITNPIYQSEFLPIIQKGETEIKKLIQFYALTFRNKTELRNKIDGIIKGVAKHLPFSLFEREKYIYGLKETSEKMIKQFYDPIINGYIFLFYAFTKVLEAKISVPITTPMKMLEFQKKQPIEFDKLIKQIPEDMWKEAKGTPNVKNYGQLVKERQRELAKTPTITSETGKKPISIWQKAELDIRHENQMNKIEELKSNGVQLAWLSSHPDCSKRCQCWQGQLVSLVDLADSPQKTVDKNYKYNKKSFLVGKIDGHNIYSLQDIMNVVDKYGYNNNIIVGFNCRHRLIPYNGKLPPKEYNEKDIKRERAINTKLREYERKIRFYKQQAVLYNKTDTRLAKKYKVLAERLTREYKAFAEKNGFAWYQYRITI